MNRMPEATSAVGSGPASMIAPFLLRLQSFVALDESDASALMRSLTISRELAPGDIFLEQGQPVRAVQIVLSGIACRFKILPDGHRQITGLVVPGDFCGFRSLPSGTTDHGAAALSAGKIAGVPLANLVQLFEQRPRLIEAFMQMAAVDEAIGREWLISLGHRTAEQRLAHLYCELFVRLQSVGLTDGNTYMLPLTQAELGSAVGLSSVHVNRTLQQLRRRQQISVKAGQVRLLDPSGLAATALFDASYLRPAKSPAATSLEKP